MQKKMRKQLKSQEVADDEFGFYGIIIIQTRDIIKMSLLQYQTHSMSIMKRSMRRNGMTMS